MVAAAYPQSVFPWSVDQVDEVNVDFAVFPNEFAAEIKSVETYLGTMPHVEPNPIVGQPVTYGSASLRMSDLLAGNNIPVVSLGNNEFHVQNNQLEGTQFGVWNTYPQVNYDPFHLFNGTDVTVPATGWYHVSIGQFWDWFGSGYHRCAFFGWPLPGFAWWPNYNPFNGFMFRDHRWDWDFPGNLPGGYWWGPPEQPFARPAHNSIEWQGVLSGGTRLRVLSENGCSDPFHRAWNADFKLSFVRRVPDSTPMG